MKSDANTDFDAIVVGAGLAGLAAATEIAAHDKKVLVLERAAEIGGRAATRVSNGVCWNIGPHALYCDGAAARAFAEFGVRYSGGKPPVSGGYAIRAGVKHALPGGFLSLLTTSLLSAQGKMELGRMLSGLARKDAGEFASTTVADWLAAETRDVVVRELLAALFRLSTYGNAETTGSADAPILQLQKALASGVLYVDGGWQTLVRGLADAARSRGARIETGVSIRAVREEKRGRLVELEDGRRLRGEAVILAVAPQTANALTGKRFAGLAARAAERTKVRAACLDVTLSALPDRRATFALGIDRPLYLSVHSASAKLAPDGRAVVHVMKYLCGESSTDADADVCELETLLDLVQPGWREVVEDRRYLPKIVVAEDLPRASNGGLPGRHGERVDGAGGIFVAGDWVGSEGMLADAAVASARRAARSYLDDCGGRARAAAA